MHIQSHEYIDDMVSKVAQHSVFSSLDLKSAYHQIALKEEEKIYTSCFCMKPLVVGNNLLESHIWRC